MISGAKFVHSEFNHWMDNYVYTIYVCKPTME